VFYIIGNIGNLLSALVFSKKPWKKNVCVFYFKIYILFNSFYTNSTILGMILSSGYNFKAQNSNVLLCKIRFYLSFLFATLPPTTLILASIDRLLISSQNVDTRLYSSKRLAYFSISISTFCWIVFNFHVIIKVNIQEYYPSVFICYYDSSKIYRDFISYSLVVINVFSDFLMIILSMFAFKNVRHIRIVSHQQRNQIRTMKKKDFQLLRCLFAHDIVFIICSLWLHAYYVYSAITINQIQTSIEQVINNFLNYLFIFIYNSSYCVSFFIFIGISRSFRQELKRMIYKIVGKNLMRLPEEENRQENIELNVVVVVSTIVS
jgi:hypothetical protein